VDVAVGDVIVVGPWQLSQRMGHMFEISKPNESPNGAPQSSSRSAEQNTAGSGIPLHVAIVVVLVVDVVLGTHELHRTGQFVRKAWE
jgi:hypothetical protein